GPGEIIVIESGNYTLNYTIDIINKTDLTIVAWDYQSSVNSSMAYFEVDFSDPMWASHSSIINIRHSKNIRFENIVFVDRYYFKKFCFFFNLFLSIVMFAPPYAKKKKKIKYDNVSFWNVEAEGFWLDTGVPLTSSGSAVQSDYYSLGIGTRFALFYWETMSLTDPFLNDTIPFAHHCYSFRDSRFTNNWLSQGFFFQSVAANPEFDPPAQVLYCYCCCLHNANKQSGVK
ncbi:hypothetical protein RFI_14716, partial [Reticulomyxa filosa]